MTVPVGNCYQLSVSLAVSIQKLLLKGVSLLLAVAASFDTAFMVTAVAQYL